MGGVVDRELIGDSAQFKAVLEDVKQVAPVDSTVLILGETGTGKELIARAVHEWSRRACGPFVSVNCGAIPAGLLESELFGHERGAFTGAVSQRMGRFQLAHRGTLFLDEIGELPLELQPKLLRVIQEQEFERLGSSRTVRVDVRIVAATNQNLPHLMREKRFREDLYYRLNVFPITLPALRERAGDIPALVQHFVRRCAERLNKSIEVIPDEAMEALRRYSWPGNIRELQNVIERSVLLSKGSCLSPCLPASDAIPTQSPAPVLTLEDMQRVHIKDTLEKTNWQVGGRAGAAEKLGLPRTTLLSRMRQLGISKSLPPAGGPWAGTADRPTVRSKPATIQQAAGS